VDVLGSASSRYGIPVALLEGRSMMMMMLMLMLMLMPMLIPR
jgi:hypothetical protein